MKGYRRIYRCPECKRTGAKLDDITNDNTTMFSFFTNNYAVLCKHCGKQVKLERVSAKPRLFGLLGWRIEEEE